MVNEMCVVRNENEQLRHEMEEMMKKLIFSLIEFNMAFVINADFCVSLNI